MSNNFKIGTKVKWKWGSGWGEGKISECYTDRVKKTFQGSDVIRDADKDEPAYLIMQEDGTKVLKSHSEVEVAT